LKIPFLVPFDKKDEFKKVCTSEGVKYFWDKDNKEWGIEVESDKLNPSSIPKSLGLAGFYPKSKKERYFVIDCDYSYYPFASKAGARWDSDKKVAIYKGDNLPTELTGFEPKRFSHQEKIESELNKEKRLIEVGKKKIVPHEHQKDGIRIITENYKKKSPGFLLADETGLGKTILTWLSILEINKLEKKKLKVLICGPLSSLETWRETIQWLGTGGDPTSKESNDIVLLNYERLKNLFKEESKKKKAKSLKGVAKFADAEAHDVIVFDESHYLKSPTSARTKLAEKLVENSRYTIWVSATAGQNPLELAYLSPLLVWKTNKPKIKDYEAWCQSEGIKIKRGQFGKWLWEPSEEDNHRLHELLFKEGKRGFIGIRRKCSDIAGWPELQRIPKPYTLSTTEREQYETEWASFLKAVEEDKLNKLSGKKDMSKGLAQLTRLRQKASIIRAAYTADLTEELLSNNCQVAISTEYHLSMEEIGKELSKKGIEWVEFSGKNTNEREKNRLRYQNDEVPVIIFTTESSISLHQENKDRKKRAQINHDLRWSAIEQEQIDGRSHRNGTHAPTFWCFSKETIEERVGEILLNKLESMGTIRGDKLLNDNSVPTNFQEIYDAITKK
jgi:SNF2-related domain